MQERYLHARAERVAYVGDDFYWGEIEEGETIRHADVCGESCTEMIKKLG
ncbi:MAG: hypothetical protein N2595_06850 [bacterium]|nr:hypothetical protein [bacterium]